MGKVTYSTISNFKSIVVVDKENCCVCGRPADHCHHVFGGSNKRWSEFFGLMIPLCAEHHAEIHVNRKMQLHYMAQAQKAWTKENPDKHFNTYFTISIL